MSRPGHPTEANTSRLDARSATRRRRNRWRAVDPRTRGTRQSESGFASKGDPHAANRLLRERSPRPSGHLRWERCARAAPGAGARLRFSTSGASPNPWTSRPSTRSQRRPGRRRRHSASGYGLIGYLPAAGWPGRASAAGDLELAHLSEPISTPVRATCGSPRSRSRAADSWRRPLRPRSPWCLADGARRGGHDRRPRTVASRCGGAIVSVRLLLRPSVPLLSRSAVILAAHVSRGLSRALVGGRRLPLDTVPPTRWHPGSLQRGKGLFRLGGQPQPYRAPIELRTRSAAPTRRSPRPGSALAPPPLRASMRGRALILARRSRRRVRGRRAELLCYADLPQFQACHPRLMRALLVKTARRPSGYLALSASSGSAS